jgi:HSP20 family protein
MQRDFSKQEDGDLLSSALGCATDIVDPSLNIIAYEDDVSVHRRERAAGHFDRTLALPAQVDAANAAADYRDGVLTLRLPRAESARARSVAIN